ncbi:Unknown protein [Striga hermonthica]|uniref:TNFR-Cys domain-containing protein n=1 Tax=Striga hermonthica TaxID=68872 RepID=A0A9N7NJE2_STRHE|nr:Unknown protein [Striga hermonthica]
MFPKLSVALAMLLMFADSSVFSTGCPSDGSQCRNCIVNRLKTECPGCAPIMQCMAKCLWAGSSRPKCVKKCDCNIGGYPRLADCKKCLFQCFVISGVLVTI